MSKRPNRLPVLGSLFESFSTVDRTAAATGVGVASLITSGIIFLIGSDIKATGYAFLSLGIVLLVFALVSSRQKVKSTLTTRQGFYGFNTTVMTLLFLAIASIVIFVASQNNARWDVTATREFSLSQQTAKILKDLNERVEAVAFLVPTDANQLVVRGRILDLLEEYTKGSDRFDFRVVDPELEPEAARRLGINTDTQPATVVFVSADGANQPVTTLRFTRDGRFQPNPNLEQDFTQALLSVTRTKQKVVYFLTRHGERDPDNITEGTGYGLVKKGLEGDNYQVRKLDLATAKTVPADAAVVVIAGPERDLLDEEVEPLNDYLRKGGRAMFSLDPETPDSYRNVLKAWGVELGQGTIVDPGSSVQGDPRSPLVRRDRYSVLAPRIVSPVTRPLTDVTFFARATSVAPVDGQQAKDLNLPNVFYTSNTLNITPLAVTTPIAWLTMDPNDNTLKANQTPATLAIGVTIEATAPFGAQPASDGQTKRTAMVVFGDSDFATNRFFSSFANGDMLLNSVNWLAEDQDLISVRPKLSQPRLLIVTQGTWNFIRWSSLLVLPVAIASAGVVVWWRRR